MRVFDFLKTGIVLVPTSCWSGLSVIEHRLKQENQGAVGFFPQYKVKLRLTSILGTHLQSGGKPMLLSAEKECFKDPSEGSLGVTSLFVVIGGRKMIVVTLRIWESDQCGWAAEVIAIVSSLVACNVSVSEWFSMKIRSANLSLTSCREKKPDLICTSTDISILDGQGWSLVTAQYRISKLLSNEPEHSAWSRMTYGTTPEVNASVPCSYLCFFMTLQWTLQNTVSHIIIVMPEVLVTSCWLYWPLAGGQFCYM